MCPLLPTLRVEARPLALSGEPACVGEGVANGVAVTPIGVADGAVEGVADGVDAVFCVADAVGLTEAIGAGAAGVAVANATEVGVCVSDAAGVALGVAAPSLSVGRKLAEDFVGEAALTGFSRRTPLLRRSGRTTAKTIRVRGQPVMLMRLRMNSQ
jgi:hypothetical protein